MDKTWKKLKKTDANPKAIATFYKAIIQSIGKFDNQQNIYQQIEKFPL
jgi:hypothetical protein